MVAVARQAHDPFGVDRDGEPVHPDAALFIDADGLPDPSGGHPSVTGPFHVRSPATASRVRNDREPG